jgi:hypothetical protein
MKIGTIALFVTMLCTGCQIGGAEDPPGSDQIHDDMSAGSGGSRLKRRTLQTQDGASQFIGWFDVERGENCSFRKVEWNVDRCIPDETVVEIKNTPGKILYFADASCERPIASLGAPSIYDCSQGLVSKYLIDDSKISCKETDFEIFQIGDRLADADSTEIVQIYSNDEGECVAAMEINANECAVLTKLSLDSFVRGGERIE